MKLIKCYISAFGKFRDFTLDFSEDLNTLIHENGWGKSTLASFIKCIFYGINSKKRNISENDRIKYAPWNYNEKFGGYVVFEKEGYEIKAERYFGKKESDDTLTLTDVKTGKLFSCPENLGEHVFKIDEEGFVSTLFFTQNDLQVKDTASISARFNMSDPSDTKAFECAVDKLEKKIKEYSNSVNRGIIPDLKNKQYSINEKIEQARLAESTLESVKNQALDIKNQISVVEQSINKVNKDLKIASNNAVNKEKADNLQLLQQKKQKLQDELFENKQILNNVKLDSQELNKYFDCVKDLTIAQNRQSVLKEYVLGAEKEQNDKSSKKPNNVYLILIFSICCALGVSLAWISIIPTIILCSVSVLGLIYTAYKFSTDKKRQTEYNSIYAQKNKEYQEFRDLISQQTLVIECFFSRFNLDPTLDYYQKIQVLKDTIGNVDKIQNSLQELEQQIQRFIGVDLTVNTNVMSLDELELLSVKLQREYSNLNAELSRVNTALLRYEEMSYSLTDLVNEKMHVQEQIEIATKNNDLLKTTLKFLNQADDNIKTLYREPLLRALNEYVSLISKDVKGVDIDIDLNLTINEKSGSKKPEFYSLGYQNLFEICKRFALIDVLYKDNMPFVVLDDPFTNLDQEKITASLELIKKLSKTRQIIYLTCHKTRAI